MEHEANSMHFCSAAAVVRRLSTAHRLPVPDVVEALMLHVEACTPHVSQRLGPSQPRQETIVPGQQASQGLPSSNSHGVSNGPSSAKDLAGSPMMQGLGASWQALADAICEAGLRASEAGFSEMPIEEDSHQQLALNTPISDCAVTEWKSLKSLLESRAWWWDRTVFDADVQAAFFNAGRAGVNPACAMAIVSDLMLKKPSILETSTFLLKMKHKSSQASLGAWAQKRMKFATEVLQKL